MSWCEVVRLLPLRLLPDLRQTPGCISACAWPLGLELLKALQQQQQQGDVVIWNSASGACGKVAAWTQAIARVDAGQNYQNYNNLTF